MKDDIRNGVLDPEFINKGMGQVLNCDNKALLGDLQKVDSFASKLLVAHSKNSKAKDKV